MEANRWKMLFMKKQELLNTRVSNISMAEAIDGIEMLVREKKKSYVMPVNVDVIMKMEKDSLLREIADNADIVLADGKPLIWVSSLQKAPLKEKVSGSDLVPQLCKISAQKGYSLFIMGGKEGIAKKVEENLKKKYPRIQIVGTYAPSFGFEEDPGELDRMNRMVSEAHPDLLIVCLGCPKQEKWVYGNYQKYDATVSICAGATVDFLARNVKRAPKWMSDNGFEWLYRLLQEPRRMFKRYLIDDVQILGLIWKYRRKKVGHTR